MRMDEIEDLKANLREVYEILEGQQFADDGEDEEDYDESDDDAGFDEGDDRHSAMTVSAHAHGKYGMHSHDDDGDHSLAPLLEDDEGSDDGQALQQMAETLAGELGYQLAELDQNRLMHLYERAAGITGYGWSRASQPARYRHASGTPLAAGDRLQREAERLAGGTHKLSEMNEAQLLALYERAAKRTGYR